MQSSWAELDEDTKFGDGEINLENGQMSAAGFPVNAAMMGQD